jgi:DNA-binding IclR family transcriptional regulator
VNSEIKSAARVLDLLELFSTQQSGLNLTRVAKGLSLPKSSTLGLLRTLCGRGYLTRDENDVYRLSGMVLRSGFAKHDRLIHVASPVMRTLADTLGETVILAIAGASGMVRLIAKETADRDVRFDIALPRQEPVYCTAIGRILLAFEANASMAEALEAVPRRRLTEHTVIDLDGLNALIAEARRTGVAVVVDEFVQGGTGIAVKVPLPAGHTPAALNVGCVTARFAPNRERIVAALRAAADEVGSAMQREQTA